MPLDISPLFRPLHIRSKHLRNRIVMPPMVQFRPLNSPEGIAWYAKRARGGVGLVIIEATSVNRFGSELTAQNFRPLVQAIQDAGALAAIQLFPVIFGQPATPSQLTTADIRDMVDNYRRAAGICAEAGFDGLEPHGAHGYVLNQFFSPVQNTRTDEYSAADMEGRMRLGLEIVSAVKSAPSPDMLILYRHSAIGQGYGIEDSLIFTERLVKAGVDILDISPASANQPADLAAPFRRFGVPVIGVNEMDRVERALEALNENRADLIAVGRGLIADPEWPLKIQTNRSGDIISCTRCNQKCFGHIRKGLPVECSQWV